VSEETSWISWFCNIRGNEYFCEVDEEYIHDDFNLTGLSSEVPYYDYALDTILDAETPNAELLTEEQQETVDAAAELLYGLIHARYILTAKGLAAMVRGRRPHVRTRTPSLPPPPLPASCVQNEKYSAAEFGVCSRVHCEGAAVLPVGQSDTTRRHTVSLYCPRCNDIYVPRSSRHLSEFSYGSSHVSTTGCCTRWSLTSPPSPRADIDGAYFGTTFAHLFLITFPSAVPAPPRVPPYVPRVYGFRIHRLQPTSESGSKASRGVRTVGPAGEAPKEARPVNPNSRAGGKGGVSGGAVGAADSVGAGGSSRAGRELTTVLPLASSGAAGRIVGRDGRLLSSMDEFLDEEDAPDVPPVDKETEDASSPARS